MFLKCLAEAGEPNIALEHVVWLKETAPSMLQLVSSKLEASLSSATSEPAVIQQLLAKIQEKCLSYD